MRFRTNRQPARAGSPLHSPLSDPAPSHSTPLDPPTNLCSYNNAARGFVTPRESVLSGVSKAAIAFCTDGNSDGMIQLSEGCLAVGGWGGG